MDSKDNTDRKDNMDRKDNKDSKVGADYDTNLSEDACQDMDESKGKDYNIEGRVEDMDQEKNQSTGTGKHHKGKHAEAGERRFESNKKYFTICVYALVTFTICMLIYQFISNWSATKSRIAGLTSMLAPFLLAFLIIYFVTPMVRNIDNLLFGKLKIKQLTALHKAISLIITYVVIIGFLVAVMIFIVPQVITSITELIALIQNFVTNFNTIFADFQAAHPDIDLQMVADALNNNMQILSKFSEYVADLIPMLYQTGRTIVSWVVNIVLAFVISCYLLWDKNGILDALKRLVSVFFNEKHSKVIFQTAKDCNRIFSKYIIGKALDSLIIGILCFILMCILRLPYALLISVFVGVTNMIPYFGPVIGAIPGLLLLLIISPKQCVIFGIMIFLLQQFDGSILGPKIIGDSTGLSPLGVIFGILAGSYFAGVVGMFIGAPVVAVLAYIANKLIDYRIYRRRLKEDPDYEEPRFVMQMTDEELGFAYEAPEAAGDVAQEGKLHT